MDNIKYDKISDQQLVKLVKEGDSFATAMLFEKYKTLAKKEASTAFEKHNKSGITYNEFLNVALVSVYIATKSFDGRRKYFYPFWKKVVQYQISDYVRENSYQYHAIAFSGPSLDTCLMNDEHFYLGETVGVMDVEEKKTFEEFYEGFSQDIKKKLNKEEVAILKYIYEGYENDEIAEKMHSTIEHVYYIRKKIREKLEKHFID